ncbi:hypothetical protein B0J12DRAFT_694536 [Macrophomina phaseolina]|uniref:Ig-like domain-containing protein n=1 Tax=Macrophomina phaseolina TaxID=35725 RepID=A0ABQ8GT23_9PEZI|nr:hypothetical protein B0J12DRAFT_694536 [Macrophomina phaseolina]
MHFLVPSLASLSWAALAHAAVDPLFVTGRISAMSASGTADNSGGVIEVNGYKITVPDNLIVQLPAAWVPWKTVAGSPWGSYDVAISGNIVDGTPIAGQIELTQSLLNAGNGVIDKVNVGGNSFTIVGGPTVVLNDPNAVYSNGYNGNPLFTADDENPSITAFSGFPMCIPRSTSDPLCPASNREGKTSNPGSHTFAAPDALVMAPFLPGDYVEFSGIFDGGVVYAYEVVAANVQITTSGSKGQPVYIRMEDAIIGVFDSTTGVAANNEFGDTRFIGYTSDSDNAGAAVTISAVEVDRCTGEETYRTVGSASLKAGDARNKFIWRTDSTTISSYTREYRITTAAGIQKTKNGIFAGQYVQPVTEWIFPEPTVPGIKAPALNFNVFNHLANGISQDNIQFGQLKPWPGASAPSAPGACSATTPKPSTSGTSPPASTAIITTPKANVGPPVTSIPGALVSLSAKDDSGNDASTLSYSWKLVSTDGEAVTLDSTTTSSLSFNVPAQKNDLVKRVFSCNITATDSSGKALWNAASVTVTTDNKLADRVDILTYTHTSQQGGTINIVAQTNVLPDKAKDAAGATLSLQFGNAAGAANSFVAATDSKNAAIAGVYQGSGKWSFGARSVKKPGSIRVVSSRGGNAVLTATTAKKRSLGGSAMSRLDLVEE